MYMIPLTKILGKAKAGYTLDDIKVNHLLLWMALNFLPRMKNCLISWYRQYKSSVFSRDIGMEVGLKKCEVTVLKRGKLRKTES